MERREWIFSFPSLLSLLQRVKVEEERLNSLLFFIICPSKRRIRVCFLIRR
jgi:hypothetical protein